MTRTIRAECGTELDAHVGEWVVDGRDSVEPLDWILGEAVEDGVVLTAHRVRPCAPADIDPALYVDALWERLGELIAEDECFAHNDGTAELTAWVDVSSDERAVLVAALRLVARNNTDTTNAACQFTGERVTVHPDGRVVLKQEQPW